MAAQIPDQEPDFIRAGDTAKWTKSLPDYPAGTWTLTYYLKADTADGDKISFSATNSSGIHLVDVNYATSESWTPGKYRAVAKVSSGDEVYTVGSKLIEILPNLGAQGDTRSHAKKVLDAIEAAIESSAGKEWASLSVEGFTGQRFTRADLLVLRDRYRVEYQNELAAERIKQGLGSGRRILTRFS